MTSSASHLSSLPLLWCCLRRGCARPRLRRSNNSFPLAQALASYSWRYVMAWIYLTVAGLFEIGWAIGLKYTEGLTRLLPSLWNITSMILRIVLLGLALKPLPVGISYAVWTGIGAVCTAALCIYLFA